MIPAWWAPVVQVFAQRVAPLVSLGARVTSGFRTVSHNAAVGGAPNSQHLLGTAVDLVPLDGDMAGLEAYARGTGLFGYVLNEQDHVHVQLFPAGVIPQWIFDSVVTQ